MKLITCLVVLSLLLVWWPWGGLQVTTGAVSTGPVVLEQPQSDQPAVTGWGPGDLWAEWPWACRPRRHPWRRLRRWYRGLRRWARRLQRGYCLWREWWTLLAGTTAGAPAAVTPTPSACPVAAVQVPLASTAPPAPAAPPPAAETTPAPARRRGRPREIPTEHLCCPHEDCAAYGRQGPQPPHDIVANGTYPTVHGERRQLFLCLVCQRSFSETAGTPLFGLHTPTRTVCIALQELAEGLGVRAVARIHGVEPDTVLDWLRKAGPHCARLSEYMMRDLEVDQVQLDELWTFVRKKERMLNEWEKLQTEYGDNWIWLAFDPVHKLVLAVLIGDHTEEEAVGLLGRLRARLVAACLPLVTSDSLPHYARALVRVFGVWRQPCRRGPRGPHPKPRQVPPEGLHYATVHKQRKQGRVISVTTRVVYGPKKELLARLETLGQTINTSFVERFNLTLRHLVSRLHRKSLCFSKKRAYLVDHVHLALAYYHFGRVHASLRVRLPEPLPTRGTGSPKKWAQRTPAMAAGLTDHIWSLEELLRCHVPAAVTP